MNEQTISCIIPVEETDTMQEFHPNYMRSEDKELYVAYAAKAHKEIAKLTQCLQTDPSVFPDRNTREALKLVQGAQRVRISNIKHVLKRLEDGTFTFECEQKNCPKHPEYGKDGDCDHSFLIEAKMVMPEVTNCANYRKGNETVTRPQVLHIVHN